MSYDFAFKYSDEGYCIFNDLSLNVASGKSPEGFDATTLLYDLAHIGDPITPIVPPPTPPSPTPPAPPVPPPVPPSPSVGDRYILIPATSKLVGPFADSISSIAWAEGHYKSTGGYTTLKAVKPS